MMVHRYLVGQRMGNPRRHNNAKVHRFVEPTDHAYWLLHDGREVDLVQLEPRGLWYFSHPTLAYCDTEPMPLRVALTLIRMMSS